MGSIKKTTEKFKMPRPNPPIPGICTSHYEGIDEVEFNKYDIAKEEIHIKTHTTKTSKIDNQEIVEVKVSDITIHKRIKNKDEQNSGGNGNGNGSGSGESSGKNNYKK